MRLTEAGRSLRIYGTALPGRPSPENSVESIGELGRRAERYGYEGLLIFYNHENLDPWIVAATLLERTTSLVPLVAVQPYAMPPASAAKMLHGLASLHRRRIDVNLITGGIRGELEQVGETLTHDERYDRATEYITVVRALLRGDGPVTHDGAYYRYRRLACATGLDEALRPRVFVAGSSEAGVEAARRVADVAVTHPEPVDAFAQRFVPAHAGRGGELGVRLGLIARPTDEEAWEVARREYVPDRRSRAMTLLKTGSESDWNRRIARLAVTGETYDGVYWTGAYRADRGLMPQLVGSYDRVTAYLERYLALGVRNLLLGGVVTEEEFRHCDVVLSRLR